jgi:anion-transporting  ArsA/GET3 family ATPase
VLSTDPAHSLAESLQARWAAEPTDVGGGVWAQQVQAQDELERNWSAAQEWLGGVLAERGVERIAAEELTVPPGADELFSLLQLKRHASPATGTRSSSTARRPARRCGCCRSRRGALVARPRARPRERAAVAARPLARAFFDLSLPDERVIADVQRLVGNLIEMHELLRDAERVTLRLVMTPDRMVVAEAMRTFTYLNLYGYCATPVVVNRVFPRTSASTSAPARGAGRAARRRGGGVRPRAGASGRLTSSRRCSARTCSTGWPTACSTAATPAPCYTTGSRRSWSWTGRAPSCGSTSRLLRRATSRCEDRARAGGARGRPQAHDRAAGRARRLQADVGQARRRVARRGVRGWLTPSATTPRPSG